jgi:putative ABC transport system permease protein
VNWGLAQEVFGMAGRALAANRLRSLLALLGIVIGVGTVIGMMALINGFQRSFETSIQSIGNNSIYIRRIRPGIQFSNGVPESLKTRKAFTMEDAEAILANAPAVKAVTPLKWPFQDMRLDHQGHHTKITFILGTDNKFLAVRGQDLARGRFFTAEEIQRRANVVVLGHDTREAMFKDASGLGALVHIGGIPFRVIGEFEPKGKFLGNNFDEIAAVPYSVIEKYFPAPNDAPPWFPKKGELFLDAVAVSPDRNDEAIREISEVLRVRRRLASNKANDFAVFSDETFLNLYKSITGGITVVMTLVSFIALVVGGIGIMNIMLVAVTERTREIGVRKALGAPRAAIMFQFLVEAVMLTGLGGALGVLLGAGISWAVRAMSPLPTYVSAISVVIGLGFSAMVGLFFGLYPAMKASKLDPVDALRYE